MLSRVNNVPTVEIEVHDGYSKQAVGPLLLRCLTSIKHAIDCLKGHLDGTEVLTGVDTLGQLKATYTVARVEVAFVVDAFKECPEAILDDNHKRFLLVAARYLDTLLEQEDVLQLRWHRRKGWDRFISGLLQFVDDAYTCLKVATTADDAEAILQRYL